MSTLETTDFCTGCGYLKRIVHTGKTGGKRDIKLCAECYGLLQRGSPYDSVMDALSLELETRETKTSNLTPKEKFEQELTRVFVVGLVLGGALASAVIVVIATFLGWFRL